MDLTLKIYNKKLNCRACILIFQEGKILLHRGEGKKNYSLPGGRIKIGESSKEAIIREFEEETGLNIEDTTFVCLMENFFRFEKDNEEVHEYCFIYKSIVNCETTNLFKALDSGSTFEWFDIETAVNMNLKPAKILEYLSDIESMPKHIINKEV